MNSLPEVMYLHGLGSSPRSDKAILISDHLSALGYGVHAPALSVPCLARLSIEEAIQKATGCAEEIGSDRGIIIAGSSFGGFVALQVLMRLGPRAQSLVKALVLLAPALYPWHPTCGMITPQMEELWSREGGFPVEESATGRVVRVHTEFIHQLKRYDTDVVNLPCPTLVIHGEQDEVVPFEQSARFCAQHRAATLVAVPDTHRLLAEPQQLVARISRFIQLHSYAYA